MCRNNFLILGFVLITILTSCKEHKQKHTYDPNDTVVSLTNSEAILKISLYGGAYIDFYLKEKPVNPLTWELSAA
jgi:hypothetical protein